MISFDFPKPFKKSKSEYRYQCFSARGGFAPQGTFDNIWRYILLSQLEGMLLASSEQRPRMLLNRTASTTEKYLVQNVSRAEVEKP